MRKRKRNSSYEISISEQLRARVVAAMKIAELFEEYHAAFYVRNVRMCVSCMQQVIKSAEASTEAKGRAYYLLRRARLLALGIKDGRHLGIGIYKDNERITEQEMYRALRCGVCAGKKLRNTRKRSGK